MQATDVANVARKELEAKTGKKRIRKTTRHILKCYIFFYF